MQHTTINQNKKILFALIICTVILLVLISWLTTLFVQKDAFLRRIDILVTEISQNEELIEKYREDAEYRKTIEFLVEWATEHKGMLTDDQLNWIKKLSD